jgi:hypothetical protein
MNAFKIKIPNICDFRFAKWIAVFCGIMPFNALVGC